MVTLPCGIEWSGRARYAAAMYFYWRGEMDAQTLEIYRYLARLDAEDPADVLRRYKIGADWLDRLKRGSLG
nr:hypothetical protein [Rhizobium sp. CG5]